MEWIKPGTNIDFLGQRRKFGVISGALVLISILSVLIFGLNFGIDFAGGTDILLEFNRDISVGELRGVIAPLGFEDAQVQRFGEEGNKPTYLVRVGQISLLSEKDAQAFKSKLEAKFGRDTIRKFDYSADVADLLRVRFDHRKLADKARPTAEELSSLATEAGIEGAQVTKMGKEEELEFQVQIQGLANKIFGTLQDKFGEENVHLAKVESVGPKVGHQLRNDGILAVIYALIGILIYIAFRFDLRFAPGAVVALAHDVTITVGIFSVFQLNFSLVTIAALLAIVGYSLNDTIVVFDRIRENFAKMKERDLADVINTSINETLSRTILTSFTTLLVVTFLFVLGGGLIQDFSIALLCGVVVGTYSSIYIASPIVLMLDRYYAQRKQAGKNRSKETAGKTVRSRTK